VARVEAAVMKTSVKKPTKKVDAGPKLASAKAKKVAKKVAKKPVKK
jgi:hypothetical protein